MAGHIVCGAKIRPVPSLVDLYSTRRPFYGPNSHFLRSWLGPPAGSGTEPEPERQMLPRGGLQHRLLECFAGQAQRYSHCGGLKGAVLAPRDFGGVEAALLTLAAPRRGMLRASPGSWGCGPRKGF